METRGGGNLWTTTVLCAVVIAPLIFAGPVGMRAQAGTSELSGRAQVDGELEILHQDFRGHSGRYLFFLKLSDGTRVPLHFERKPPTHLLTGARVRARGMERSDGGLNLASGATGITALSAPVASATPLANTLGAQPTLVILVNFQDTPSNQPYAAADARSAVFGTASSFILENSYRQTWLSGDVAGWYTIPVDSTACDSSAIATYAQSAASAAGIDLSAYSHFIYAFPQNKDCGWAGSSNIGGNPSQSWINGVDTATGQLDIHVLDHELGH